MTERSEHYERIADQLETIVADLDEIAFDELRLAAAEGATERPPSDKRLTAARRSLEKAIHLLRQ